MNNEEIIVSKIFDRFEFARDKIHVQKRLRIISDPFSREEFEQIIEYLHDELGFKIAHHIVGIDYGEDLGFIYMLGNDEHIIFALKEKVSKENPEINSMTKYYPSLLMHELELVDLFGAIVKDLPDVPSYPLPDGWPKGNHPMRKDWNPAYFDHKTMTYNPPAKEVKENEKQ